MNQAAQRFDLTPITRQLRGFVGLVRYVIERFLGNGGTQTAASLTYTSLFAVVPLMTVTFALLSAVEAFAGFGDVIRDFVFENFLPSAGAVVQEKLAEFSAQARQLTAVGFAFLVVTSYMMLSSVESAFNDIWSVREPRRGMARFLLYWGILTLSPLLLGLGFAISSYLFSLPLVAGVDQFGLRENLLSLLPFVLSGGAFTVLFAAVPNTRVPLKDAAIAGIVCMFAFEEAKHGFAFVMQQTAVEVIYGTFAAVPLFLTWLYLAWTIVLLGAELTHALGARRYERLGERSEALPVTLEFLALLHGQHQRGGGLPQVLAAPVLMRLGPDLTPRILEGLEAADIVCRDGNDNWLPGRDFDAVRLDDVVRALPGYWLDFEGRDGDKPWQRRLEARLALVRDARGEALSITLGELFARSEDGADDEDAGATADPDVGRSGPRAIEEGVRARG